MVTERKENTVPLLLLNCCMLGIRYLAAGVFYRVITQQRVYMLQFYTYFRRCSEMILNRMIASIPRISSVSKFFMNIISVCYFREHFLTFY
jgi:hypothetical protein